MKPTLPTLIFCSVLVCRSLLANDPTEPSPASRLLSAQPASLTPAQELLQLLPTAKKSAGAAAKPDACCAAKNEAAPVDVKSLLP